MSVIRIPCPSQDLKSVADTLEANIDRLEAELGADATVHFSVESVPGATDGTSTAQVLMLEVRARPSPSPRQPSPPRRRSHRPRRAPTRSGKTTPYKAKRAAMEDLDIRRLRRDGFTPYFGEEKRFFMTPPEFDLVLACESRQVAQVIYEVLRQSVGYAGDGEHGRREWVTLSQRHFERRGLMSQSQAERALRYAVEQGYLLRRRCGRQRWEYALHYRQGYIVPR
jgi:hypothetical protein